MHKSILDIDTNNVPKGARDVGGYHTHVLSDLPEDTDVFHVLTQKNHPPETIRTEHHQYVIGVDKDGGIIIAVIDNKK
jgi:hypothetical protein